MRVILFYSLSELFHGFLSLLLYQSFYLSFYHLFDFYLVIIYAIYVTFYKHLRGKLPKENFYKTYLLPDSIQAYLCSLYIL